MDPHTLRLIEETYGLSDDTLAAERGMTWTELCRALADGELALTG